MVDVNGERPATPEPSGSTRKTACPLRRLLPAAGVAAAGDRPGDARNDRGAGDRGSCGPPTGSTVMLHGGDVGEPAPTRCSWGRATSPFATTTSWSGRTSTRFPRRRMPDGLEIRPVEDDHLRPIFDAAVEAAPRPVGLHGADRGRLRLVRHRPLESSDRSLWRIAWDGDQIAGQVRAFINPTTTSASARSAAGSSTSSSGRHGGGAAWRGRSSRRASTASASAA